MSKFEQAYNRLNPQQKLAVDTIEGSVMVIAGPGTGKTQILTLRIANILQKTQTDPSSILALTFTDSGVKAMKERLVEFIGPTGYQVDVFTFHSFCKKVIEDNPENFPISGDVQVLGDLERVEIFRKLIDELKLNILRPKNSPYYFIDAAKSKISDLKKEGITPSKFIKIIEEEETALNIDDYMSKRTGKPTQKYNKKLKDISKWKELHQLYVAYQEELKNRNRYDYDDMITYVVEAFTDDDELLAKYQEQYQFILGDEYQDTNSAQNEVIRLLTSFEYIENPNVFVVGDDEQSIYRFQGASMENFEFFEKTYPELKKITLVTNYRSTQNILDASRSVIENNENRLEDVERLLKAYQDYENKKINIAKLSHEYVEKYFIAKKIQELIKSGVQPCEIAVLYRKNSDGQEIAGALGKFGVTVQAVKGENVLDDLEIKKLIKILQVILEQEVELRKCVNDNFFWTGEMADKDVNIFTIMHYPIWEIATTDILKLTKYATDEKKHLSEILTEGAYAIQLDLECPEKIGEFWEKILKWKKDAVNEPFAKFLELVIRESGLLNEFLTSEDKVDRLNKLGKFFGELKDFNYSNRNLNLADFFNTLSLRQENKISIPVNDIKRNDDAVQLMTAHSAKGLEYEYVFVYKCIEGNWGDKRHSDLIKLPEGVIQFSDVTKIEKNEDERRLFYVAMTRAKKELFLTFAQTYIIDNNEKQKLPSVFVSELKENYIDYLDIQMYEEQIEDALETLVTVPMQIGKVTASEEEFLSGLVKNISISPTSLNTYLQCPYKFKMDRLFSIPKVKSIPLAFGTSVHKALEDFMRQYANTGIYPNVNVAVESFRQELERQLLNKQDHDDLNKRGVTILEEYLQDVMKEEIEVMGTEYNFGKRNVYLNKIKLSGKIDRIDVVDKDRKEVRVIDYKTGRPKSLNEILGKTQNSDESYKRQLVFYKLLSQLDRTFNKIVTSARLEFAEKNTSGKYKHVDYCVTDEDLSELRNTIQEVAQKIKRLEFPRTTNYRYCGLCEYKDHCWPEGEPGN